MIIGLKANSVHQVLVNRGFKEMVVREMEVITEVHRVCGDG